MLDVPRPVVEYLARLLAAHRRQLRTPKGARALGPFQQAILILRWFRDRSCVHCLARDAGVSQATGYRYLHEGIDVLAACAPDLHQVLAACRGRQLSHLVLDGTLVGCDRVTGTTADGNDLWYSGKHKQFGGTIQFLATPEGTPVWVSDVEPGSVHDLTAARRHVLGACYPAAAAGLPILADAGYEGAGVGVHTPVKKRPGAAHQHLHPDNQAYNQLLRGVRSLGERAAAELKERWRALKHITLSPHRIGHIAKAALVLNNAWR